ncbi:MAG: flagellar hook-basal body complex protein FliE [Betaproteobacteria bacterium]
MNSTVNPIGMHDLMAAFNAARASLDQGIKAPPAGGAGGIGGVGGTSGVGGIGGAGKVGPAGGVDFAQLLKASLDHVDASQNTATDLMQKFQLGDPKVSLEETMVAVQKASLVFQEVVQVRNKVVAAYHDIMSMQV